MAAQAWDKSPVFTYFPMTGCFLSRILRVTGTGTHTYGRAAWLSHLSFLHPVRRAWRTLRDVCKGLQGQAQRLHCYVHPDRQDQC